jgi:transposase
MVFRAFLTRGKGGDVKLLYRCCAGLDIHRDTVSACIRKRVRGQAEAAIEEQVFGTFTQDLVRLRDWLKEHKVRQVALESTGVYWIPIWNVLERGNRFTLTLVNPATVRALQGQKTDRIDARRIAEYLQYGLLRGSFIPPKPVRELRELTRMRVHIQQDRNRVGNRIARLLETVNIKLASVASHILGRSGRAMLHLLASGVRDPERLAECARGQLRIKIPALILALDGRADAHFRWMLSEFLAKLDGLEQERARLDGCLAELAVPYADVLRRLGTIPGVDITTALILVAEFGTDMTQFPIAAHLASWAGLCPGNAESAGRCVSSIDHVIWPRAGSLRTESVGASRLQTGPLCDGASAWPFWFPSGRAATTPGVGALLWPPGRRVLPWLLTPVDSQIEQVIIVIHHLDPAARRPVSFEDIGPLSQITNDVHPAHTASN